MQELVLEKLNETHYMSKNFTLQTHQALISSHPPQLSVSSLNTIHI